MLIENYVMEKTFNYNISDLQNILKLLKTYEHSSPEIDKDIERLQHLINYLSKNPNTTPKSKSLKTLFKEDIASYQIFTPYYSYIKAFVESGHSIDEIYQNPIYKKIKLSNLEAVQISQDFIRNQGPFFSNPLDEFNEDINTHLKFVSNNLDTSGGVLYLYSTGDAFVFSPDNKDITKASVLTHELEHVIDSYNNPNTFNTLIAREIIPVFMETLSLPAISRQLNLKSDGYQRMLHLHSIIKESALMFIDKMDMLELISKHFYLKEEDLIRFLNDNGYDNSLISLLMDRSLTQDFFYLIPELITIELYFLYQEDKQRALNILQAISLNATDSNILDIVNQSGITLNENVDTYEKHLLAKVKR